MSSRVVTELPSGELCACKKVRSSELRFVRPVSVNVSLIFTLVYQGKEDKLTRVQCRRRLSLQDSIAFKVSKRSKVAGGQTESWLGNRLMDEIFMFRCKLGIGHAGREIVILVLSLDALYPSFWEITDLVLVHG